MARAPARNVFQIGWAIQQEKRGKEYRNILIAPEGYDFLEFDASGQEFRWMAIQSKDETMLQLCMKGEDPHTYMGAQIYSEDYHNLMKLVKQEDKASLHKRKLGKLSNLSLQYRTGAARLCAKARVEYDLPMELPEAKRLWITYRKTYPEVPVYWDVAVSRTRRKGFAETLGGRRVQVTGDWTGSMAWAMEGTAINYPIQGTGGDQKYLALSVLKPYLVQHGMRFVLDLHDGIYFLCPKNHSRKAIADIKQMLDNLPYKKAWGFVPPVPLPWDAKIGPSWGELHEVKE